MRVSGEGADQAPQMLIVAGPNGAGKSTAVAALRDATSLSSMEFVDADVIERELRASANPPPPSLAPSQVQFHAGKLMARRLRELASERRDFAFETTLATRGFQKLIRRLQREAGYRCHITFLWLPSPDLAVARVAARAEAGGHAIDEETIRRRYGAGLSNFFSLYRQTADSWRFHDNSEPERPRFVAKSEKGNATILKAPDLWRAIRATSDPRYEELRFSAIQEILASDEKMLAALSTGGRRALEKHALAQHRVARWRDGKAELIPAEEALQQADLAAAGPTPRDPGAFV
jgi:predicted ABC-type ATPase